MKIAQKYNSVSFAPTDPIKSLEHGNYKLFGLNKSKIGKTNKFITTQRNMTSLINSTADSSGIQMISTRLEKQRGRLIGMSAAGMPQSRCLDVYKSQFSRKGNSLIKQLGLQKEYAISFAKQR